MTKKTQVTKILNDISFQLKELEDFSFLDQYGKVFKVFDQNDSGNISFGVENDHGNRYFIKVAGAKTVEYDGDYAKAVKTLKRTTDIYKDLRHETLIDIIEAKEYKHLFYVVFRWSEGECLYDHWNFDYYQTHPEIDSPKEKFYKLTIEEKLLVADKVLEFLSYVEMKGYVPVDFYDGSLMYNFENNRLIICDIDLFEKSPNINQVGKDYWGTKRMKAPEEYQLNAVIDSKTTVFTIGSLFFNLFGRYSKEVLNEIYSKSQFIPIDREDWTLPEELYEIASTAVNPTDMLQ